MSKKSKKCCKKHKEGKRCKDCPKLHVSVRSQTHRDHRAAAWISNLTAGQG